MCCSETSLYRYTVTMHRVRGQKIFRARKSKLDLFAENTSCQYLSRLEEVHIIAHFLLPSMHQKCQGPYKVARFGSGGNIYIARRR